MISTGNFSEYFVTQTTLMDLVAAVSEASTSDAETIQVVNYMLQEHDFWYDGQELN